MLDIFFADDVRRALMAADEAVSSTAKVCVAMGGDQVSLRAYLEGYRAALTTVALAFGVPPPVTERAEALEVKGMVLAEAER